MAILRMPGTTSLKSSLIPDYVIAATAAERSLIPITIKIAVSTLRTLPSLPPIGSIPIACPILQWWERTGRQTAMLTNRAENNLKDITTLSKVWKSVYMIDKLLKTAHDGLSGQFNEPGMSECRRIIL